MGVVLGGLTAAGETDSQKAELQKKLAELSEKFGLASGNLGPRTTTVAKSLASMQCERRIAYALSNPEDDRAQKFDSIFREKSQWATVKIIDRVKQELDAQGFRAAITTEAKEEGIGRYDVAIVAGDPSVVFRADVPIVRIEVKAALGLPLEQVERYLWNPTPLIVARLLTSQVVLFKPDEMAGFVEFSLSNSISKAARIAEDRPYVVPGNCYGCPDRGCQFNSGKQSSRPIITLDDADWDLMSLFRNVPSVAERTAILVLKELRSNDKTLQPAGA